VVHSEEQDTFGQFELGKKEPVQGWVLYVIIAVTLLFTLLCCSICCCFVRKMYNKKKKKGAVKKFDVEESRLEKYRYTPREITHKT